MYARLLPTPAQSAFLFGPRGTGKSTWLRQRFPRAAYYDLLDTGEALRLAKDPGALYREISLLPRCSWAVIDEVQKAPELLDEVHRLIERHGLCFVLSGSSARKLRRGSVNLLAGRAVTTSMFPLTSAEVSFNLEIGRALEFGMLPMAVDGGDPGEYLRSYADTYLAQEVRAEALTRNVGAFARFLEIAALRNGQPANATNIAREAGVHRRTVESHFQVLDDTLLGYWLPAWKLKPATRQVLRSKFYFFDCGVVRALTGRLAYPPTQEELGAQMETFILSEIRAYLSYSKLDYRLHYWRTYDGAEVAALLETAHGFLALDIKAAARWAKRYNRGLLRLREALGPRKTRCLGVCAADRPARWGDVLVLPVLDFLKRLWGGELIR